MRAFSFVAKRIWNSLPRESVPVISKRLVTSVQHDLHNPDNLIPCIYLLIVWLLVYLTLVNFKTRCFINANIKLFALLNRGFSIDFYTYLKLLFYYNCYGRSGVYVLFSLSNIIYVFSLMSLFRR